MPIGKSNGTVATTVGIAPAVTHETAPAPVSQKLVTAATEATDRIVAENRKEAQFNPYEAKDKKILVQGVTQAVLSSPAVAGLGYTNEAELVALVKRVATQMIEFVREQSK